MSLAEDLVIEILERLPTKSLMRFKSVHRSWNALFKTNSFVCRHSQRQKQSHQQQRFIIFHAAYDLDPGPVHKLNLLLLSSSTFHVQDLQYPLHHRNNYHLERIRLLGYYNGVLCIRVTLSPNSNSSEGGGGDSFDETIVWNPATKETKVVTHSPFPPPKDFCHCFGFGAAHPNTFDDFKLIKIYYPFPDSDNANANDVFAEVYNINTNSCTLIQDIGADDITSFDNHSYGLFSNGVCHWLAYEGTHILCFDLASNKSRKVNTPLTQEFSTIHVARDSIAYAVRRNLGFPIYDYNLIEIWILNQDYCSWTKLWNVGTLDVSIEIYALWKDDTEFIGGSRYHALASYDSRAQPKRLFQFSDYGLLEVHMHEYVESIATFSL
ncbi:hypothetical protein RIF29_31863 [Crotalaria pallida]|uniref:F-box domain-containing protein n=1 Tax=Crotalaria pallida TaxID=3830 RepID=A0AAN9EMV8_CROPI